MARPGVASTLIGASKVSQLESNIAATDIQLTTEQMKCLDEASAPPLGFSSSLVQPFIRRMIFGGHDVSGWGE
jgi:diketogulonate reductase-like aldo/keto reductase